MPFYENSNTILFGCKTKRYSKYRIFIQNIEMEYPWKNCLNGNCSFVDLLFLE